MAVDRVSLVANPTYPRSKEPVVWASLMALAGTATDDVIFQTPYYVASDAMNRDLAAVAAGRPTRLLLNSAASGDNVVASGDYLRERDEVLSTGVQVVEYFGEYSNHAKSAVFDEDLSVVGSFNLDMLSTHGKYRERPGGGRRRVQRDPARSHGYGARRVRGHGAGRELRHP